MSLAERIETLYLATLSRKPNSVEIERLQRLNVQGFART
jgi:hypothetical protein